MKSSLAKQESENYGAIQGTYIHQMGFDIVHCHGDVHVQRASHSHVNNTLFDRDDRVRNRIGASVERPGHIEEGGRRIYVSHPLVCRNNLSC